MRPMIHWILEHFTGSPVEMITGNRIPYETYLSIQLLTNHLSAFNQLTGCVHKCILVILPIIYFLFSLRGRRLFWL